MIEFESLLKKSRVYKTLISDKNSGKLSHCNMIISEDEIACNNLCKLVARGILCKADNCGKCKDCLDVENAVHVSLITPEALNSEGIRDFISKCYYSVEGESKVVLIENFQAIDAREQNRLLKLLEEPSSSTIFILGVTKISAVLDTIKSRATKLYIEEFSDQDLYCALDDKFEDKDLLDKAIRFAEGSLTKALNMANNEDFIEAFELMEEMLLEMKNSSMIIDEMAKLDLSKIDLYLEAIELISKQVLEHNVHLKESQDDKIIALASTFNVATLVNVTELVIDAKKKLEQFCNAEGVFSSLLMKILEVKYKCR